MLIRIPVGRLRPFTDIRLQNYSKSVLFPRYFANDHQTDELSVTRRSQVITSAVLQAGDVTAIKISSECIQVIFRDRKAQTKRQWYEPKITLATLKTPQEISSFDLFCSRTKKSLSCFFQSESYHRCVLQAAAYEPSVFHRAVSLGALHGRAIIASKAFTAVEDELDCGGFALRRYNKAMQDLVCKSKSKLSVDVVLSHEPAVCFHRGTPRSYW